jgi:glycosyltransferase involved in cell wall biosynthesis
MSFYINGKFLTQKKTGVQQFGYLLTRSLIINNIDFEILVPKGHILFINDNIINSKLKYLYSPNLIFWEQIILPVYLFFSKKKLLINFSGIGPIIYKNKIITIHDLSYLEHPEWFSKLYYLFYKFTTPLSAKFCLKIITVSNYSKTAIIKHLNITNDKIGVVHNFIQHYKIEKNNNSQFKYILTVGSLNPRKNIELLIEAFLKWNNKNYKLIIIGDYHISFKKINYLNNDNVIFTGYLSDESLHEYYVNSDFFVYPSLYEGFGIPLIEAMAHNIPIIASNQTCIPEVCHDAAYYVNPRSIDEFIHAFNLFSKNNILKSYYINNGRLNLKRFSIEESFKSFVNIFNSLRNENL